MQKYIREKFSERSYTTNVSTAEKEKFERTVLQNIEFATGNASDYFSFTPPKTLETIIPDTGGPFDHFSAHVVFNEESFAGEVGHTITFIQLYDD